MTPSMIKYVDPGVTDEAIQYWRQYMGYKY
jgi:hypothetical protein